MPVRFAGFLRFLPSRPGIQLSTEVHTVTMTAPQCRGNWQHGDARDAPPGEPPGHQARCHELRHFAQHAHAGSDCHWATRTPRSARAYAPAGRSFKAQVLKPLAGQPVLSRMHVAGRLGLEDARPRTLSRASLPLPLPLPTRSSARVLQVVRRLNVQRSCAARRDPPVSARTL
jgi:hypothetical protein